MVKVFDVQVKLCIMAGGFLDYAPDPKSDAKRWLDGLIHAERHVKIICFGTGASGLLLAYKLERHFSNYTLTVYEKNPKVSGAEPGMRIDMQGKSNSCCMANFF